MRGIVKLVMLSAALSLNGCGDRAGEGSTATDTAPTTAAAIPQLTDGNIVALLSNIHQAELSLAATARTGAASDAVREYAARMIEEHGAMKRALDSLVTAKAFVSELPAGTEPLQATIAGRADTLLHTTGRSTDIAYMDGEAKAHGANLELLNRYADAARDEDLRALIRKTIPTLRLHQDRAIDILRGL